jgi:hypothetical protein
MTDFVRVKLENGAEVSVSEGFAETHSLKTLDKPATDNRGAAAPAKPKTSVASAAGTKSTALKEDPK